MGTEFNIGIAIGLAISGGVLLFFCIMRIEEGFVAVLTAFGRAEYEEVVSPKTGQATRRLKIWGPGLHLKFPWQKAHTVSMMERHLDLSGREGGRTVMTNDGILLRLDSKLRYHLNRNELYEHLFKLKDPVEHMKGLFTCLLRTEIANFKRRGKDSSEVSYELIRTDLNAINDQIENFCETEIAGKYGVNFDGVELTDILPPDELVEALNAVINAQTETQTRYARAEAECQQKVLAAQQGVEIARARGQAVETEILTFAEYIKNLYETGTLKFYLERRTAEVHLAARSVFARRQS